jgi:phosphatidylinositol phospholipase C delta
MAEYLRDLLGSALLMPGEMLTNNLPSLEQLKGKVLIKGKRLSAAVLQSLQEGKDHDDDDDDDDSDDDDDDDSDDDDDHSPDPSAKKSGDTAEKQKKKQKKQAAKEAVKDLKEKRKQIKIKTHPDLSALTYLGTCHYKSFSPEISASIPPDMMTSYSESKTKKLLGDPATLAGWIDHNKNHLSRIYPKGNTSLCHH